VQPKSVEAARRWRFEHSGETPELINSPPGVCYVVRFGKQTVGAHIGLAGGSLGTQPRTPATALFARSNTPSHLKRGEKGHSFTCTIYITQNDPLTRGRDEQW